MPTKRRRARAARLGRPPKKPELLRDRRIVVMLTRAQYSKLERLAGRSGLPPGTVAYQYLAGALKRRKG